MNPDRRGPKKKHPTVNRRMPLHFSFYRLDNGDIGGGRAFLPLHHFKFNPIAFIEGFKTGSIDGGMVYENVGTILLLDKPEPLTVVKPFYSSVGHGKHILLSIKFSKPQTGGCLIKKCKVLQKDAAPSYFDGTVLIVTKILQHQVEIKQ